MQAAVLDEFNDKYFVVNEAGKAVVYAPRYDRTMNRGCFDRLSFSDLRGLYMNRHVVIGRDKDGNEVTLPVAEFWLRHAKRRQFIGGIAFDPTGAAAPDTLNLWQGFAVAPKPGDWSLLRDHVRSVICGGNDSYFAYLVGWMARMLQQPAEKAEVAVVLKGKEGTGKGTLARALQHILGQHALAITHGRHLTGNFNAHLRDCVFLFADEAFYAGDKQHVGVLKALVTEPIIAIEAKYQNTIDMRSYLHIMMASNEEWVVPASIESRRFCVFVVPDTHKCDHAYFAAIWKQMESGGYEAMLHDMLSYDLSNYNVRAFPTTDGLNEQRKLSLAAPEAWWMDVLQRGFVFKSKVGLSDEFQTWMPAVATELLYGSYSDFAAARRERHPLSREAFGRFMNKMGGQPRRLHDAAVGEEIADVQTSFGTTRKGVVIRSARPHGFSLGDLATARAAFTAATGLAVEWIDDVDTQGD